MLIAAFGVGIKLMVFSSADIEQEVNGLYTFNREEKLDASRVKAVLDKALQSYYSRVR